MDVSGGFPRYAEVLQRAAHGLSLIHIWPSTSTPERIDAMIKAGLDVARLNFSHGSAEIGRAHVCTPVT